LSTADLKSRRQRDKRPKARKACEQRSRLLQDLLRRIDTVRSRFHAHENPGGVHGARPSGAGPQERDCSLQVRIFSDDIADSLHIGRHFLKRGALRRAQADVDRIVVLLWDKALRHDSKDCDGGHQHGHRQCQNRRAVPERDRQALRVRLSNRFEHAPGARWNRRGR
jgi:hypothetical protein